MGEGGVKGRKEGRKRTKADRQRDIDGQRQTDRKKCERVQVYTSQLSTWVNVKVKEKGTYRGGGLWPFFFVDSSALAFCNVGFCF